MRHLRFTLPGCLLSLAAITLLAGCSSAQEDAYKTPEKKTEPVEKVHGSHKPGPHGGKLVDLGDHEFLAEIVFKEEEPKTITVYLLEHDDTSKSVQAEETELRINGLTVGGEEISLSLAAKPQEADAARKSSQYEISGEAIPAGIEDVHELADGRFSVTINGKPYSGTIEVDHGHDHEHDHGEEEDHEKEHHKEHEDEKDEDHKE